MASSTTTRRVLSDLNVNTPSARVVNRSPMGGANSPQKPCKVGEELSLHVSFGGKMGATAREDSPMSKSKRGTSVVEDIQNSPKRRKTQGGLYNNDVQTAELAQCNANSVGAEETGLRRGFLSPKKPDDQSSQSSTSSGSPSSCFGNSTNEMNDTQNTIITEPDNVPFPATRLPANHTPLTPLTSEELRQKARAIKLRLSLASYKVRTNQIDIPISRLQIRSSSSSQKLPSLPRTNSNTSDISQRRTALPSSATVSSIPNIHLQKPSAQKKQVQTTNIPSSPPQHRETDKLASPTKGADITTRDGFATPILPKQRAGLLNPPQLGSPLWDDGRSITNELTSSVVKGRAADGLLSLMRQ